MTKISNLVAFINGRSDHCELQVNNSYSIVNPSTGIEICKVQSCTMDDVDKAAKAASQAMHRDSEWSSMPSAGRRDLLLKMAELLANHKEEVAYIEAINAGKPLRDALGDMDEGIDVLRYFAGMTDKVHGEFHFILVKTLLPRK
jgi:acyl-CoA reductase-like NAD-dependent aldehyde dehydrogenase